MISSYFYGSRLPDCYLREVCWETCLGQLRCSANEVSEVPCARTGGERRVGRVPCSAPRLITTVGRRGSHICSCLEVEDVEWWGRGVMWCVKCNGSGGHPAREPVHPQDVAGLGGLLSSPHRRAGSSVDPSIALWFACTLDASSVSDKVELTRSLKCPVRSKQIIIYSSVS